MSVRLYFVFVLSCVGSGLATSWSPIQGVLPTVYKIHRGFECHSRHGCLSAFILCLCCPV
jgi:hypothetical protein